MFRSNGFFLTGSRHSTFIAIAMSSKSSQLSRAIASARQEAHRILHDPGAGRKLQLHTHEWVLPTVDSAILAWIKADARRRRNALTDLQQNLLIWGDDLPVMKALLVGDHAVQSLRGKIDLICIHPARARHAGRCKPIFPWIAPEENSKDFESCLAAGVLQLVFLRELLSEDGTIYVHANWDTGLYAKAIMDEIFAEEHASASSWREQGFVLTRKSKTRKKEAACHADMNRHRPLYPLEDIILSFTEPDAVVADFFGGLGETAIIAEQLGRRWIIAEPSQAACLRIRERLIGQNAAPFLYQSIHVCPANPAPSRLPE
jgi:hypothetical protein